MSSRVHWEGVSDWLGPQSETQNQKPLCSQPARHDSVVLFSCCLVGPDLPRATVTGQPHALSHHLHQNELDPSPNVRHNKPCLLKRHNKDQTTKHHTQNKVSLIYTSELLRAELNILFFFFKGGVKKFKK